MQSKSEAKRRNVMAGGEPVAFEPGDLVKVVDWPGIGYERYVIRSIGHVAMGEDYANMVEEDQTSPVRSVSLSHLRLVRKAEKVVVRPKEENKRATPVKRGK